MNAFLTSLLVGYEVRSHGQGVALHQKQVGGVVQLFVQGGDVPNAVLGDNIFLGRGNDRSKNGQSKAHVRQRRPHGVQLALPHLGDVVGIAERGKQGGKQQCHSGNLMALEVVEHEQRARQDDGTECCTHQFASHHANVAFLVFEPLGQAHEQKNEYGERHLNQMVGAVQIGARCQIVLRQVPKDRPTGHPFGPRQQRGEGFQEMVEDGHARLPSDVDGPKHQQQRAYEHPKFPRPQGVFLFVAFELFAEGTDGGRRHDPKKGEKAKCGLSRGHQTEGGQCEAPVDFPRRVVLEQHEVTQSDKGEQVGEELRQDATVHKAVHRGVAEDATFCQERGVEHEQEGQDAQVDG